MVNLRRWWRELWGLPDQPCHPDAMVPYDTNGRYLCTRDATIWEQC